VYSAKCIPDSISQILRAKKRTSSEFEALSAAEYFCHSIRFCLVSMISFVLFQEGGEFKKAAPEEIAKRRIVKARRGGAVAPAAATSDAANADASAPSKPAVAPFSWTTSTAAKGMCTPEPPNFLQDKEEDPCSPWMYSGFHAHRHTHTHTYTHARQVCP
jgi:hypothetical protein